MREFLLSGEPILMTEVGQWLVKRPAEIHSLLIQSKDESEKTLLVDLAAIAELLACQQISSQAVRTQLEEKYNKALILTLTSDERRNWIRTLSSDSS